MNNDGIFKEMFYQQDLQPINEIVLHFTEDGNVIYDDIDVAEPVFDDYIKKSDKLFSYDADLLQDIKETKEYFQLDEEVETLESIKGIVESLNASIKEENRRLSEQMRNRTEKMRKTNAGASEDYYNKYDNLCKRMEA